MKISEVVKVLNQYKKKFGDLDVVYSSDEEGNSYGKVFYHPTPGCFLSEDQEFVGAKSDGVFPPDVAECYDEPLTINAVCIN